MLVPRRKNVKASAANATVKGGRNEKSPSGAPGRGQYSRGWAKAGYFAASGAAPRVSSTIRWMRCATPSGRLTSPIR